VPGIDPLIDSINDERAVFPGEIGATAFHASDDAPFVLSVDGGLQASNGQPNFSYTGYKADAKTDGFALGNL
jgi:hypothetical protein